MARTIDTYATKAQSWNDLLHEYEVARSTKPPPAEKPLKQQKDNIKKQHEFDIMTGVYKDPRKEIFARELEAQRVSRDVVRDAHAPIHRDFDIVANTDKQCAGAEVGIGDAQSRGKLIRGLSQPPRPYDIVTIRENPNKDAYKPEVLEKYAQEGLAPVKKVTLNTPPSFIRDYSIVSNKYLVDHDDKQKMDDNLTLKAASQTLFKRQKYDPIVGQFISEKLDKEDWDKRSSSAKKLQSQKLRDLPPCVQTREENSVDVISNQIKDQKAFKEQEDKKQDWIQRRGLTVKAVADKKQGELHTEEHDFLAARHQRRVRYDKFKYEQERGYNIISNKPDKGIGAGPVYPPLCHPLENPFAKEKTFQRSNTIGNIHSAPPKE